MADFHFHVIDDEQVGFEVLGHHAVVSQRVDVQEVTHDVENRTVQNLVMARSCRLVRNGSSLFVTDETASVRYWEFHVANSFVQNERTTSSEIRSTNAEDFDRVDAVRADCDAILVGAGTLRADNPKLLVRSTQRQQERLAKAQPPQPRKVTLTATGHLDPGLRFFQLGECDKLVYCPSRLRDELASTIGSLAMVIAVSDEPIRPELVLTDLHARGVRRLLVEGGSATNTMFLASGLVDELRLAVAPFFVGQANAPRFVQAALFPHDPQKRMQLQAVEAIGDVAVLQYRLEHHS